MIDFKKIVKGKIYQDSILTFGNNLTVAIINITVLSILARNLSKADFGIYGFFLTLVNIATLFSMQGYLQTITKSALIGKISYIKRATIKSLKSCCFFSIFGLLSFFIITNFINIDLAHLYYLAILSMFIGGLDKAEVIFMGTKNFKALRRFRLFYAIINISFTGYIAYTTKSILYVIISFLLCRLIVVSISLIIAFRSIVGTTDTSDYDTKQLDNESVQLSLLAGFNVIVINLDRIIMFSMAKEMVAVFQSGQSIPFKIKDHIKSFTQVPLLSWMKEGPEHYHQKIKKFAPLFILLSIIASILMALAAEIYIPLIFGAKYEDSIIIAQILSFYSFIQILNQFLVMNETINSDTKFMQKTNYAVQIIYLIVMLPLVKYYGAVGAASAIMIHSTIYLIAHVLKFKSRISNVSS